MKRIKNFFKDFKKFISRGNILDLAIALVVGSAFTQENSENSEQNI